MKKIIVMSLFVFFQALPVNAATDISFDYPELQVSPLASTRLKLEAIKEKKNTIYTELPLRISALSTLVSGITQLGDVDETKDDRRISPYIGIIVGAGWLSLSHFAFNHSNSYLNAFKIVSKLKKDSKREQLVRERVAEEEIKRLARIGKKMKWLSFLTNAATNAYIIGNADKDSLSIVTGGVGLLSSFAPLLFPTRWEIVLEEQKSYKKKIYSPISFNTLLYNNFTNKFNLGLQLSWNY